MAEANQQEPSMEEILSSIRRIISADTPAEEAKAPAEEEAAAPPPPPPPPEEEPEEEDEDVLELTDVVEPDSDDELDIDVDQEIDSFEPAAHFGEPEVADDEDDDLPDEEPEAYEPPPVRDRDYRRDDSGLVSPPTAAASMAAFASLQSASRGEPLPFDVGGRTVEQLAAELMRPILRDWLDQNLPTMVERLVRAEIKRLAEQSRR